MMVTGYLPAGLLHQTALLGHPSAGLELVHARVQIISSAARHGTEPMHGHRTGLAHIKHRRSGRDLVQPQASHSQQGQALGCSLASALGDGRDADFGAPGAGQPVLILLEHLQEPAVARAGSRPQLPSLLACGVGQRYRAKMHKGFVQLCYMSVCQGWISC